MTAWRWVRAECDDGILTSCAFHVVVPIPVLAAIGGPRVRRGQRTAWNCGKRWSIEHALNTLDKEYGD